jgi:hypothetical protein
MRTFFTHITFALALMSQPIMAHAQTCLPIDPSGGPVTMQFPGTGPVPTVHCHADGGSFGISITCIHGISNANVPLLGLIAGRVPLSATNKNNLVNDLSIRGGFSYFVESPNNAKTVIFADRQSFRDYINANYSSPNTPKLFNYPVNMSDDSATSVAIAGNSGLLNGYHVSGNLSTLTSTLFHIISDTQDLTARTFIRLGDNLYSWISCVGLTNNDLINFVISETHKLHRDRVQDQKVLFR